MPCAPGVTTLVTALKYLFLLLVLAAGNRVTGFIVGQKVAVGMFNVSNH